MPSRGLIPDCDVPNTPAFSVAIETGAAPRAAAGVSSRGTAWPTLIGDAGGRTALAAVALLVLCALMAPWLAPFPPSEQLDIIALKSQPPTLAHWFGTDPYSRDVLSRVLYGTRVSLRVAVFAAGLAGTVGLLWGAVAGFTGGRVDAWLMSTVDALMAVPRVLLVLTTIALWGEHSTPAVLIMVLGLTGWFGVARFARTVAFAVRDREFVIGARALGVSNWRILLRHVLPHAAAPAIVAATVAVGDVIVLEAGLSFLGYGIPQPTASWGNIIYDGRESIAITWWLTLFPGLALITTALAINAIADRLRSALNPRELLRR